MARVLFFSTIYPRAYDRVRGTYCHDTCRALAVDHEVCVVSPRSWLEAARRPRPADAALSREVGRVEYPVFAHIPRVGLAAQHAWMWASLRRRLRSVTAGFRPEAILSYWAHPDGAVAVRLGRELGVPTGIIVGGSDVLILPRDPARRAAVVEALRGAQAVFAVSTHLRDETIALGVDPGRVHVVMQGVDESFTPEGREAARERLGLAPSDDVLLWVGRMDPVKGLEVLMEAMRQVVTQRPSARLVLAGDGPARRGVERDVERLGLGGLVRLLGAVAQQRLPDWYRAADLTVLSSHSEGIPNVLRESLACGTPYVSTRVGGIAELYAGPEVRLVPPRDAAALAAAILASLAERRRIPPQAVRRGWKEPSEAMLRLLRAAA